MADHLMIFSLQPPPFTIFSCSSLHRRGFGKLPGGARLLSSQLQLGNCISPSQSSSSSCATEKFGLVSTTQLKDGSHVFRFGDASEIERNLEIEAKERCFELEKQQQASEVLKKQGDISNVIKIKDRKRIRSPTKKKKETPISVNVSRTEDEVEAVSIPRSAVSVVEASSSEEELVVSKKFEPVNENVELLSSQVMEKVTVNEIRDNEKSGYQQLSENVVEVQERPRSSTQVSTTLELNDNLDVKENPFKALETEENLVTGPTTSIATLSPHEVISKVAHTDISKTPVIESSNGDDVAASTTKDDNGSLSKTISDTIQLPTLEMISLDSTEPVSSREEEEELVTKALYLDYGVSSLQSNTTVLTSRQDAYFISNQYNWLGIADGVSQWSFNGIMKGTYAQELMTNCENIVSKETDPVQVLHRSINETKSHGSSTVLIAHLDHNMRLNIANIGDSGFIVIRNGKVLQKSSPMFHHFGFPLQVTKGDDVLKLAEVYCLHLEEGDVVVTATDGLFDNLYEKEIVSLVCKSIEQSLEPQKIAELLAVKAREVGGSEEERTPFGDEAKEEGYDGYKGGKVDHVTVIVSFVKTVC